MPSDFAALWTGVQGVFDATFGEPVDLVPQIGSPYLRKGDDPDNQRRSLIGIFNDASMIDSVRSGGSTHENTDVLTRRTTIDFDQNDFVDSPLPVAKWVVVATSQPRQPRYTISSVQPDGLCRIVCNVVFLDFSA